MRNRFAAAVVLVALLALRANAQDSERLPVPEADAVAAEVRIVQQAFEGEYADAANGDASKLISTLLGNERKAKSAERRYALWQEAERTAGLAGDVERCLDIVRKKATVFELDGVRAQIERLKDLQAQRPTLGAAVYTEAVRLANEAYASQSLIAAESAVAVAKDAAASARPDKAEAERLADIDGLITATLSVTREGARGRLALEADPNDSHARGQLGLAKLLVEGDAPEGLKLLADSDLVLIRKAAGAELVIREPGNGTSEQIHAVATLWWDAVDEAVDAAVLLKRRAAALYARAAGKLSDPVDAALARRRAGTTPSDALIEGFADLEGGDDTDESDSSDPATWKGAAAVFRARSDAEIRARMVEEGGGNADTEAAVDSALDWIIRHQLKDGSWSFDLSKCGRCRGECTGSKQRDDRCAATSLALLPFLARGETHQRGPNRKMIKAGLVFLGKAIESGKGKAYVNQGSLYSQGLAATALTESYVLTRDTRLKRHMNMAVDFIVDAQDPIGGGWRYQPKQPGDTSVTGWQVAALANANAARITVPPETFKLASVFLDSVQADDGRLYGYRDRRTPTTARNAIGLLCRLELGATFQSDVERDALRLVAREGPSNDLYHDFFAAQLLYRARADDWKEWNDKMISMLLTNQVKKGHEAGSWFVGVDGGHAADSAGRLYTTSMATLILEVYYRILPPD
jgi:hypothetical protein